MTYNELRDFSDISEKIERKVNSFGIIEYAPRMGNSGAGIKELADLLTAVEGELSKINYRKLSLVKKLKLRGALKVFKYEMKSICEKVVNDSGRIKIIKAKDINEGSYSADAIVCKLFQVYEKIEKGEKCYGYCYEEIVKIFNKYVEVKPINKSAEEYRISLNECIKVLKREIPKIKKDGDSNDDGRTLNEALAILQDCKNDEYYRNEYQFENEERLNDQELAKAIANDVIKKDRISYVRWNNLAKLVKELEDNPELRELIEEYELPITQDEINACKKACEKASAKVLSMEDLAAIAEGKYEGIENYEDINLSAISWLVEKLDVFFAAYKHKKRFSKKGNEGGSDFTNIKDKYLRNQDIEKVNKYCKSSTHELSHSKKSIVKLANNGIRARKHKIRATFLAITVCISIMAIGLGIGNRNIKYNSFRTIFTYVTEGGEFEFQKYDDTGVVITSAESFSEDGVVEFPSYVTLNDSGLFKKNVVAIGENVFNENATKVTNIIIPKCVKYIGKDAFSGCTSLTEVTFEKNSQLEIIASHAFALCSSLANINIPAAVTIFGEGAFSDCRELSDIMFAENSKLTNIENNAFAYCSNLKNIVIPKNVINIGKNAFLNCSSLSIITIPKGVANIGSNVFSGCNVTIHCEVESRPGGWAEDWNGGNTVIWSNSETVELKGLEFTLTDSEAIVTGFATEADIDDMKNISIPSTISVNSKDYDVTKINEEAFKGNELLMSVTFAENSKLTSIASNAFAFCSSLNSISIPESVTNIEKGAFENCTNLDSITVPFIGEKLNGNNNTHFGWIFGATGPGANSEKVPDSLVSVTVLSGNISANAFYKCADISDITFGDGVAFIGSAALHQCNSLVKLTLPFVGTSSSDSTNAFLGYIFGDTSYQQQKNDTNVPASLTEVTITGENAVADCAFAGLKNLETVTLNAKYIGNYVFAGCKGLKHVYVSDKIMEIGNSVFFDCENLDYKEYNKAKYIGNQGNQYLILVDGKNVQGQFEPNSSTRIIADKAFFKSSSITAVKSTKNVIMIGDNAFEGCASITYISISESVANIGMDSFKNCSGIENLTVAKQNNKYSSVDNCLIDGESKTLILGCKNSIIPTDKDIVTCIGSGAFSRCVGLESINIPNNITDIGNGAFINCLNLNEITIPFVGAGNDEIEYTHFGYIFGAESYEKNSDYIPYSLKNVVISGGDDIDSGAFYKCDGIAKVSISASIKTIGEMAFEGCNSLQEVVFGDNCSLFCINDNAFLGCKSLESISIPESVTEIGEKAFYACESLGEIEIIGSIKQISEEMFSGCLNLISVTIPDSVVEISSMAFYNCSGLKQVLIGKKVEQIGDSAFFGCAALSSIRIPENVKCIGTNVFRNCEILKIYCEVVSKPSGWSSNWNSGCPNIWDFNYEYVVRDNYVYLTEYNGKSTDIIIPSEIDGYSVVDFGTTFRGKDITSIIVPDSVLSIASGAFFGCANLESIAIPFVGNEIKTENDTYQHPLGYIFGTTSYSGATAVEQYYYGSSTSITTHNTYYIPSVLKNVTVTGGNILYGAFYNCTNLIDVLLPENLSEIGDYAFYNCGKVSTINLPDSIDAIGSYAFYGCSARIVWGEGTQITELGERSFSGYNGVEIAIPNSVTDIGYYAFHESTADIVWGDMPQITQIGAYAFSGYKGEIFAIPDSVEEIGDNAFSECSNITGITMSKRLTIIGENAFSMCSSLLGITIPEGVETIGAHAFENCRNMLNAYIPISVENMGEKAFMNCNSLQEIGCETIQRPLKWDVNWSGGNDNIVEWGYWLVKAGYKYDVIDNEIYLKEYTGNEVRIEIPAEIGDLSVVDFGDIFSNSQIKSVVIPDSIRNIAKGAFAGCAELNEVIIEDGVMVIGEGAFAYCSNLVNITIPASVKGIGDYAFCDCTNLAEIMIGKGVSEIGSGVFDGCNALEMIEIDRGNIVYYSAGNNCIIESATNTLIRGCKGSGIPDGVIHIGDSAFYNCMYMTEIIIPNSVISIGRAAFALCSGLTGITIPDSVMTIGENAFIYCRGLRNVTIGNKVKSIGSKAFGECELLVNVDIPGNDTKVGDDVFYGCKGMASATIAAGVSKMGVGVFRFCNNLAKIYCEDEVKPEGWDNLWIDGDSNTINNTKKVVWAYKGDKAQDIRFISKEEVTDEEGNVGIKYNCITDNGFDTEKPEMNDDRGRYGVNSDVCQLVFSGVGIQGEKYKIVNGNENLKLGLQMLQSYNRIELTDVIDHSYIDARISNDTYRWANTDNEAIGRGAVYILIVYADGSTTSAYAKNIMDGKFVGEYIDILDDTGINIDPDKIISQIDIHVVYEIEGDWKDFLGWVTYHTWTNWHCIATLEFV